MVRGGERGGRATGVMDTEGTSLHPRRTMEGETTGWRQRHGPFFFLRGPGWEWQQGWWWGHLFFILSRPWLEIPLGWQLRRGLVFIFSEPWWERGPQPHLPGPWWRWRPLFILGEIEQERRTGYCKPSIADFHCPHPSLKTLLLKITLPSSSPLSGTPLLEISPIVWFYVYVCCFLFSYLYCFLAM